jgi:hypothetical protein
MANKVEDIDDDINTILTYCGSTRENNRIDITEDGFESFEDIMSLSEDNLHSLPKGFAVGSPTERLYLACVKPIS